MSDTKKERSIVLLTLTDWDLQQHGVKGRLSDKKFAEVAEALIDILNEDGHWEQAIEKALEEVF